METKVSYTLVGLFVIVFGTAAVGALLWLAAGTDDASYTRYQVYVSESVAGLNKNAAVRYRGVDVGRVNEIRLDPEDPRRVRLTLDIDAQTPILEDTRATLSTQGLTGLATVELSGGDPRSAALRARADEPFPVIRSAPSFVKRLDDAFSDTMVKFDRLSASIERLLNADNAAAIGSILKNLNVLSATLAARTDSLDQSLRNLETLSTEFAANGPLLSELLSGAAKTFDNAAVASAELPLLVARLSAAAAAAETVADSVSSTSRGLSKAVADSRADLRRVVQRTGPELNATLAELGRLADSVQRFVNELERTPQMLLLGKPPPPPGPGE